MFQELATQIYNKEKFSPFDIKTLKNQDVKNILSLCIEVCDLYSQELKENFSVEFLCNSIKEANKQKPNININNNTLNKLGQTIITKEQDILEAQQPQPATEDNVVYLNNESTAKSYNTYTQKFNDSINDIFKHLQEKEKQSVGVVMFDYLWRKMAVNAFVPESEKTEFPEKEPLLKYQYYTKLYENNIKNKELPQMVELKIFLAKQIIYDYNNRTTDLSSLNFNCVNGQQEGYRTTFIDGQSRYYALSGVVEKYMLVAPSEEFKKQISFKVDPVGLLMDGVITPEVENKNTLQIK